MLRLTLDLVPRGNEKEKRTLGTVEIENIGWALGGDYMCDYAVKQRGDVERDATVRCPREPRWSIVAKALGALGWLA